jgi:hypothetical protein
MFDRVSGWVLHNPIKSLHKINLCIVYQKTDNKLKMKITRGPKVKLTDRSEKDTGIN